MSPLERFRLIRRLTLPGSAKCLLFVLASHANRDGVCYPGLRLLAQETGYSERTIRTCYRLLKAEGLLILRHRRGRSTLVKLTLDAYVSLLNTPATIAAPPRQPLPPEVAHLKAATRKPSPRPWTMPCSRCGAIIRSTKRKAEAVCSACSQNIPTADVIALFPEAKR